jgi:hypothetical protein
LIEAIDLRTVKRKAPAKRLFVGGAGSPLAAVSAALMPVQAPPKDAVKPTVLVHFCFNQEAGESKPSRCNCAFRVSQEKAYELIDAGRAHFLLVRNPKTDKLTKFHRAIVMLPRKGLDGQTYFALAAPLKPDTREAKHKVIRNSIRLKAKRVLQKAFSAGVISQQESQIGDADLEKALENPEPTSARLSSHKRLHSLWSEAVRHWWNNILGFHHLSLDTAKFLTDADRGAGLSVTGGYDSAKIDIVTGARETDDGRVAAANFRVGYWNEGWVSSVGTSAKVDEDEGEQAERIEQEHSQEDSYD